MPDATTNIQVGDRTFPARDWRNEPLVYDVLTPPHVRSDANLSWARALSHSPFLWHWTSSGRTPRYEQRILNNLRVYLDAGIDPLDFYLTFTVSGSQYVNAPLHAAMSVDFLEPCVIEDNTLTFMLTSQKAYNTALRMQFIFNGYRKQVVL